MNSNKIFKYSFKKDKYSRNRGGSSCFLDIYCSSCNNHVALYQKDGMGALIRMYIDRIFVTSSLTALQLGSSDKKNLGNLCCNNCKTLIGVPMVYVPESRLAYRLIRGSYVKKKSNGLAPP